MITITIIMLPITIKIQDLHFDFTQIVVNMCPIKDKGITSLDNSVKRLNLKLLGIHTKSMQACDQSTHWQERPNIFKIYSNFS